MANESGLSFVAATTADLKANFLGQSANRVKNLFERVRASAPAILFLDEIDILARDRAVSGNDSIVKSSGSSCRRSTEFTNQRARSLSSRRPTAPSLDRAILSRFTQYISIPLPDLDGRRRIWRYCCSPRRSTSIALRPAKAWLKCPMERATEISRTGLPVQNKRQCSAPWSKAVRNISC